MANKIISQFWIEGGESECIPPPPSSLRGERSLPSSARSPFSLYGKMQAVVEEFEIKYIILHRPYYFHYYLLQFHRIENYVYHDISVSVSVNIYGCIQTMFQISLTRLIVSERPPKVQL